MRLSDMERILREAATWLTVPDIQSRCDKAPGIALVDSMWERLAAKGYIVVEQGRAVHTYSA